MASAIAMRLDDKVVLLTGASEGIGAACAVALRDRGARLALVARSHDKLQALAGRDDLVIAADVTSPDARQEIIARTLERFGRIDVLVNNAGAGLYAPAHLSPDPQTRALWELNFFAPLDLIRLAVPSMKQQGSGAIVNVGSIAGKMPLPWFTLYSASKYAIGALTDGLRMELHSYGIHCMTVCPGYVNTRFQANVIEGKPPALAGAARRWAISPEQCARDIVRGLERNARTVVTPASGWLLIGLQRLFPAFMDRQLESVYRKQGH